MERAVGPSAVLIIGSVRGLLAESGEVRAAADAFGPDCIVLPIGEREREEIEVVLKEKGQLAAKGENDPDSQKPAHGPTGLPLEGIPKDIDDDPSDYEDFGLFVSSSDMVFMKRLSTVSSKKS